MTFSVSMYRLRSILVALLATGLLLWTIEAKIIQSLEGELEVLVADDFRSGAHHYDVFIHHHDSGKRYQLDTTSLGDLVPRLLTGNLARIKFEIPDSNSSHSSRDHSNMLEREQYIPLERPLIVENLEVLNEGQKNEARRDPPRGWNVATLRRLLVIVVDFEDEQVACSAQDLSKTIWGAVNPDKQAEVGPFENVYRIFQTNSANQVQIVRNSTLNGLVDIVGPYRLSRKLKDERFCTYNTWAEEALAMALDADVPVTRYTQISFVLPNSERLHSVLCHWTGLAHVGCGFLCRSWISDCTSIGVFAHEFGHNAGFAHAGSHWEMQGNPIEYGDPTEIMSNQWSAAKWREKDFYFGPIFRSRNAWLPAAKILSVPSQSPPKSSVGLISTSLDYQRRSQRVEGEKRANYNSFHRDGSYFAPTTARIFQLTPFHLSSVIPGTYQSLKIERTRGSTNFWISFRVGNVAFPQHAIVQFQPLADSTQTTILQTIVPSYPENENITINTQTTLWKDFDNLFALRVLRTSDSIMDLQMTWVCEWRTPWIQASVNGLSLERTMLASNISKNDQNFDLFELPVSSTSRPISFTLKLVNMDSDMCEPSLYEIAYVIPDGLNLTCIPGLEIQVAPGLACSIDCTLQFLHSALPTDPTGISLSLKRLFGNETLRQHSVSMLLKNGEKCIKNEPNLRLHSDVFLRSINHEHVPVLVTLTNKDSNSCKARVFNLATQQGDGWIVDRISGMENALAPGKIANATIFMRPLDHVLPGNETTVYLSVIEDTETLNDGSSSNVSFVLRLSNECQRNPPIIEMWDTGVSFYVRTTVTAPIRVTNNDSESCPPISAWFDLVPESTGFLQHVIFPQRVVIPPGEAFEWKIAVTTPDTGRGPHAQSRLTTLVQFHSDHPLMASHNISQNTWTVPLTCKANEPSLGITCPSHQPMPISKDPNEYSVVRMECSVAWRNNDNYLCPAATWNLTIGTLSPPASSLLSYLDGSDQLLDVKLTVPNTQRIMAGETIYGLATLFFNMTGFYSQLSDIYANDTEEGSNENVRSVALFLNSTMEDISGENAHFGSLSSSLVQFGRCYFESLPTIALNHSTGPYLNYSVIVGEEIEISPQTAPDVNDSVINQTDTWNNLPMVVMPIGISRAVNWTVYNPTSIFCSKTLFSAVLDPQSIATLNEYNVKYALINPYLQANTSGDLQIKFTTQPSNRVPVGPIEVSLHARYLYNSTTTLTTEIQKVMLNVSHDCEVRRSEWKTVLAMNDTVLPSYYAFHMDEPVRFYAILNLTNQDSSGCSDWSEYVSTQFQLSSRRSWSGINRLLEVKYVAIDELGQLEPESPSKTMNISPQSWQLFNFTFAVPSRLPPGKYGIEIYASSPGRPEHQSGTKIEFEVKSKNPRPAWDLHYVELKGGLSVSIGFDLQWRACERPGDCICPCQYDVFVNNAFEATVNHTFFAYRYSMAQAGVYTSFRVVVSDAQGRRSTENACESEIHFTPADSAYSHLFILIVLAGVALFPSLILLLEWLRSHDKLPLSSLDFEDHDQDNEVGLLAHEEAMGDVQETGNAVELDDLSIVTSQ